MSTIPQVDYAALAKVIKAIREIRGLKQQYVAAQLHIKQSLYSRMEHGNVRIYLDKFLPLCAVLHVSPFLVLHCAGCATTYPQWQATADEHSEKHLIDSVMQYVQNGGG
jgi:transcriptional regulator with XRE-family HTH domain